jgi:hypothetical protein
MKRSVATFAEQMFGSGRAILSLRDSFRRDQFLLSVLSAAARHGTPVRSGAIES